jgi:heme oxygenase
MTMPYGFIDPPSPFDPPEDWREFIAELEAIPEPEEDIRQAIADAKQYLAEADAENEEEEDFADLAGDAVSGRADKAHG